MPDFIPASSRTRQCLSSLYLLFHLVVRFCYLRSVKARQPHSSPLYGVILVFHTALDSWYNNGLCRGSSHCSGP